MEFIAIARPVRAFYIPLVRWLYAIALSQLLQLAGAGVLSNLAIAVATNFTGPSHQLGRSPCSSKNA